ncbi:glycine cleavage system protein T [Iodidimonas muriae]|uniref:Glycine cleavage system protein T n=1 Tax=Iodidimonas muriae TaxID=261467 RepID=A0ABQ2LFM6_9PROT|nr:folate-binding protein YgfZ [Iodidimonas muriae]GER07505.1 glycine cleavage system protein T [Kordiimonadales bacterium JCM 17843]GGO14217.1 glycine cleavage system protein T [Iodidimonas muriae]
MPTPIAACKLHNRAVLSITGPDSRDFLQGILTNTIFAVGPDRALYAALLTPQGKMLFDFFITAHQDALLFDCESSRKTDLIRRLMMYRLRAKAEITDRSDDFSLWAIPRTERDDSVFGDLAKAGAAKAFEDGVLYCDPRDQGMGWRAILPQKATIFTDQGMEPYESLRLSRGMTDGSRDFVPEKTLALEANLDVFNGVDFSKGCYVGQELTARTKHRGKVRKRLVPIEIDGDAPQSGTAIEQDGKTVGDIRSSHKNAAIALLRMEALEGPALMADGKAVTVRHPSWLDGL